jgi:hypothetical protein
LQDLMLVVDGSSCFFVHVDDDINQQLSNDNQRAAFEVSVFRHVGRRFKLSSSSKAFSFWLAVNSVFHFI